MFDIDLCYVLYEYNFYLYAYDIGAHSYQDEKFLIWNLNTLKNWNDVH